MKTLQKETAKKASVLTFDGLSGIKDPSRFRIHAAGNNVYIFDRHSSDIIEISDALGDLIKAGTESEFDALSRKLSQTEMRENAAFTRELLNVEDRPIASDKSKTRVSVLKLNTSTKCNLSCAYCFRDKGHDAPAADPSLLYKAVRDMVDDFGRDAQSYTVCLDLASEPLMNMETLRDISAFTRKLEAETGKGIEIFFITNGIIATKESLKLIKNIKKDRLVSISIDGPGEVHDAHRIFPDGTGSYDPLFKNIQSHRRKGIRLTAESVITGKHPYPLDILTHLIELGFERVNMKPVRRGTEHSFDVKSNAFLKKGYVDYFSYITDALLNGNYYILKVLCKDYALKPFWRILFNHKMNVRCGWGINSISMYHKGDYYPCDSVMGI
jgi:uncharacterized protein